MTEENVNTQNDPYGVFICPMSGTEHYLNIQNEEELPPFPGVGDIVHTQTGSLIVRRLEWVLQAGRTIKVIVRCEEYIEPVSEVIDHSVTERKTRRRAKSPTVVDEAAKPLELSHATVH